MAGMAGSTRLWRIATMVAVLGMLLALGHGALAEDNSTTTTVEPAQTDIAPAGSASGLAKVLTMTSSQFAETDSITPVRLTRTPALIVPAGQKQRFLIRFTGQSKCAGAVGALCSTRFDVGGTPTLPDGVFVFDVTEKDPRDGKYQVNSVDTFTRCLGPGSYPLTIDYVVGQASGSLSTRFSFTQWNLIVEQVNNCA